MATPVLLYDSKTWTLKSQDLSRIQVSEIRYLRLIKNCTIANKIQNEINRNELKIFNLCDRVQADRANLKQHAQQIPMTRLPRAALDYTPKGRRDKGCPRKWLIDQ